MSAPGRGLATAADAHCGASGLAWSLPFTRFMDSPAPARPPHVQLPLWAGFCLFLAIAVFLLWEEHRAHLFGFLPYALLLLCPIIHLFMHRGHGEHGSGHGARS